MSNHPPPLPLPQRLIVLRTTPEILKQTNTSIFFTGQNLLMCLLLSLFLLSLHGNVETATHFLTSFTDNNPSIKSVIDRNNAPPNLTFSITSKRRHQLTGVGILDDGFFSRDDEFDHQLNGTSFILDSFDPQLGLSNFIFDNGSRASEIFRSSAKMTFRSNEIIQKEENVGIHEINDSAPYNETGINQTYYQSFLKRIDLEHHEFTAILIFSLAFVASYWFMLHVFIDTYSKVQGIIFVLLLNDFCKIHNAFFVTFSNGSSSGVDRLSGSFIAMRWAFRGVFNKLLCFWFFGGIDDPYSLFKIFVRSNFMSFSIISTWDKGLEEEVYGFMVSSFLLDMLMSFVFAVGAWIVMANSRKNVKQVVKENCHLLSLMIKPAIELKIFECIVCGMYARWVLTRAFGVLFALAFQSLMEVYFMVAWLMYYLSVKSIDANSRGKPFGQQELEAMLRDDTNPILNVFWLNVFEQM